MGNLCDSGTKPDEIHEVDAQAAATTEIPESKPEAEATPAEAAPAETPAEAAPEPPPAAETPAPAADGSFTVTVVKAEGKTLKMGIKSANGKACVNSIAPDGLISEFNAANPATAITDAIKAAAAGSTLTIVMKRPVSTTKEFTIELVKEDGKPLKVGFSNKGDVMVVTSIQDDGLMAAYNKANPATALAVGDAVLSANGNTKVADGIKGTAAGSTIVLKVKRG